MGHVSTDEIIEWLDENDRDSYDVLAKESMSVSLHRYQPGSEANTHDRIHEDDELYYVISGSGKVRIEDDVYPVIDGDTIFVDAGDWHTFVDIDEQIVVLKVFPSKSSSAEVHREELPFE
jgi:mannose-6-phosphate isomerase-like protein (cupin superfamily)